MTTSITRLVRPGSRIAKKKFGYVAMIVWDTMVGIVTMPVIVL